MGTRGSSRGTSRAGPGTNRRPAGPASVVGRVRSAVGGRPENASGEGRRRPRPTGRAAIVVLLLAVLTISYASSMRAYLHQRAHIADLKAQIAERGAAIEALEREKRRWEDPAFVRTQARLRFGYLMPGETGFLVLDQDGQPLDPQTTLAAPEDGSRVAPTAWWTTAWESMELAGNPPSPEDSSTAPIRGQRVGRPGDS